VGEARFIQQRTLYAAVGDLVAYLSMAAVIAALAVAARR
jgi:hypothetical protein